MTTDTGKALRRGGRSESIVVFRTASQTKTAKPEVKRLAAIHHDKATALGRLPSLMRSHLSKISIKPAHHLPPFLSPNTSDQPAHIGASSFAQSAACDRSHRVNGIRATAQSGSALRAVNAWSKELRWRQKSRHNACPPQRPLVGGRTSLAASATHDHRGSPRPPRSPPWPGLAWPGASRVRNVNVTR